MMNQILKLCKNPSVLKAMAFLMGGVLLTVVIIGLGCLTGVISLNFPITKNQAQDNGIVNNQQGGSNNVVCNPGANCSTTKIQTEERKPELRLYTKSDKDQAGIYIQNLGTGNAYIKSIRVDSKTRSYDIPSQAGFTDVIVDEGFNIKCFKPAQLLKSEATILSPNVESSIIRLNEDLFSKSALKRTFSEENFSPYQEPNLFTLERLSPQQAAITRQQFRADYELKKVEARHRNVDKILNVAKDCLKDYQRLMVGNQLKFSIVYAESAQGVDKVKKFDDVFVQDQLQTELLANEIKKIDEYLDQH